MGVRYHFVTEITLGAPSDSVQSNLEDVDRWPAWWKWARTIESLTDRPPGTIGSRHRHLLATPLGFQLGYVTTVTHIADGSIAVDVSGDLHGMGLFEYEAEDENVTWLSLTWMVSSTRPWMNLIGRITRRPFETSHHRLMTDFAHGLAHATEADEVRVRDATVRPTDPGFFEWTPHPPRT